jgi:DNA-binding response OmpR family regulator
VAGPRILVVDDDPWTLRMITAVLEKRGYPVDTARDGEEGLQRALRQRPDLIITDVMMPRLDGWSLVKALRSRGEFAFVPVIFLTALGSEEDRIRGFRLGADDYLTKPFRFDELELRVTRTLKRADAAERSTRAAIGAEVVPSNAEVEVPTSTSARVRAAGASHLAGTLSEVGLAALLTLLEMERKSGTLLISRDDAADGEPRAAELTLRRGRVVRARLEGRSEPRNAECVYALLEWVSGAFDFVAGETEGPDEIVQTISFLLMEGARLMDERKHAVEIAQEGPEE